MVPQTSASEGLPKGVSTNFSVRLWKMSGLSRPVPPMIPICTRARLAERIKTQGMWCDGEHVLGLGSKLA